jgi:hypothetical protein
MRKIYRDYYLAKFRPNTTAQLINWFKDASKRQIHGLRDNDKFNSEFIIIEDNSIKRKSKIIYGYKKLVCHCRYISRTMVNLLEGLKIDARCVEFVSSENDLSDCRHTCFEINFENKFIHVDIDCGVMFVDQTGNYLSSIELFLNIKQGKIRPQNVVWLNRNKKISPDFPVRSFLKVLGNKQAIIDWYGKIMGSIMIDMDIYTYGTTNEAMENVKANIIPYKKDKENYLSKDDFRDKYYL